MKKWKIKNRKREAANMALEAIDKRLDEVYSIALTWYVAGIQRGVSGLDKEKVSGTQYKDVAYDEGYIKGVELREQVVDKRTIDIRRATRSLPVDVWALVFAESLRSKSETIYGELGYPQRHSRFSQYELRERYGLLGGGPYT